MTSQLLKRLQLLVWICVGGVGVSFILTVVTAVQTHQQQAIEQAAPVALPAGLSGSP